MEGETSGFFNWRRAQKKVTSLDLQAPARDDEKPNYVFDVIECLLDSGR